MIQRSLQNIIFNRLFKGKAIIILGPRQVGKTTLVKMIADKFSEDVLWLNGDETNDRNRFNEPSSTKFRALIGNKKILIIDEAQRISDIGICIKLIVDNIPDVQVIATGSSSFDLANKINEPLTGRKFEYFLYPLSFSEMRIHSGLLEEERLLEHRLIFGYYPEIVVKQGDERELLSLITNSYLFKDLYSLEKVKKPALLEKLLQALALQIGNEVSFHELAQLIGADNETVERYVYLLEQGFVIFRLGSLSRNLRNEIKRSRKIYFWDNGIRNALISRFNPISIREDIGALWENFLITERIKINHYNGRFRNYMFWRTHAQQEIDFIEDYDGQLHAYEFKWNPKKKYNFSKSFSEAYPNSELKLITKENYLDFIT
ncbi:MAG: ATP-binding protein [Bacteroidales bacterium]|nr:ATP-binding protein [Bacteroidales bacterium]